MDDHFQHSIQQKHSGFWHYMKLKMVVEIHETVIGQNHHLLILGEKLSSKAVIYQCD